MSQSKQSEWHDQWSLMSDNELFLFRDWIKPNTMDVFKGKDVLECGCGGGQHTSFVAPYAKTVTSVDLNTTDIARERNKSNSNVEFVEADIGEMDLGRLFDVVFSIGVIHHTDDPDKTFRNIAKHAKPGGKVIVWVYSKEGNFLVEHCVEPVRKLLLRGMSRKNLLRVSRLITLLMYPPIYTVYLFPLTFLPFYEYFRNFRRLSLERNILNVFDKLNAPQVDFISEERIKTWFSESHFYDVTISPYIGVSWRGTGTRKPK